MNSRKVLKCGRFIAKARPLSTPVRSNSARIISVAIRASDCKSLPRPYQFGSSNQSPGIRADRLGGAYFNFDPGAANGSQKTGNERMTCLPNGSRIRKLKVLTPCVSVSLTENSPWASVATAPPLNW
jgi:hypothetical protein